VFAMVEGLAAAGASVIVSSRKQDLCEQVADEVASSTGAKTLGLACVLHLRHPDPRRRLQPVHRHRPRLRDEGGALRIFDLQVILDTSESKPLREVRDEAGQTPR